MAIERQLEFSPKAAPRTGVALAGAFQLWIMLGVVVLAVSVVLTLIDRLLGAKLFETLREPLFSVFMIGYGLHVTGEFVLCLPALWRQRDSHAPPRDPDRTARVRVHGDPNRIGLDGEDVPDVPFEPEVYWLILPMVPMRQFQPTPAQRSKRLRNSILGGVAGVAFAALFLSLPRAFTSMPATFTLAFAIIIFASIVAPLYVRITPGRLEILRYSPFRSRPTSRHSFDLRTARVDLDLRRWTILLVNEERQAEIALRFLPSRRQVLWHVLLGAMSTHARPALEEYAETER